MHLLKQQRMRNFPDHKLVLSNLLCLLADAKNISAAAPRKSRITKTNQATMKELVSELASIPRKFIAVKRTAKAIA